MSQLSEEQRLKIALWVEANNRELERQIALIADGLKSLGFVRQNDSEQDSPCYCFGDDETREIKVLILKPEREVSVKEMRHKSALTDVRIAGRQHEHMAGTVLAVVKELLAEK